MTQIHRGPFSRPSCPGMTDGVSADPTPPPTLRALLRCWQSVWMGSREGRKAPASDPTPSADPTQATTLSEIFAALRQLGLAEKARPQRRPDLFLEAAERLRRTLELVLQDEETWQVAEQRSTAVASHEPSDLSDDDRSRARQIVTDAMTEAMHRAGHRPPPPEADVLDAVHAGLARLYRTGAQLTGPQLIGAAKLQVVDVHDELVQSLEAAKGPSKAGGGDPPAVKKGVWRRLVRAVGAAKEQALLLGAAGLLAVPAVVAGEPGQLGADVSTNLAATAIWVAGANAVTRYKARKARSGVPAAAPDSSADEDHVRRERARTEQEEQRARAERARADREEAEARRARAEAAAAERRLSMTSPAAAAPPD